MVDFCSNTERVAAAEGENKLLNLMAVSCPPWPEPSFAASLLRALPALPFAGTPRKSEFLDTKSGCFWQVGARQTWSWALCGRRFQLPLICRHRNVFSERCGPFLVTPACRQHAGFSPSPSHEPFPEELWTVELQNCIHFCTVLLSE